MATKSVLVGLGNPIMSDDGVGLVVCREVHKRLTGFDIDLACSSGFDIVDRILGYDIAVIVDSMVSGQRPPGAVAKIDLAAQEATLRSRESHGTGFALAIETARSLGASLPRLLLVYGIEVIDPFSVGGEIAPAVLDGVDRAAEDIALDIEKERSALTCTNWG